MDSGFNSEEPLNAAYLQEPSCHYKTAAEYAEALRLWMTQVYHLQCMHAFFPYFLANLQAQACLQTNSDNSSGTSNQGVTLDQRAHQQQRNVGAPRTGVQYVVPPIWKRAVAEFFDFLLLFIIKLAVTYAAVDALDLLEDVEKYDFEALGTDLLADYRMALNMTSEILFLEIIHRIGTCIFEALCLRRGARGVGGATPGKRLMGLRVIRCEWVAPAIDDRVIVYPATDLGFGRALVRSFVKNISLTFLFPICFALFSFQNRRTVYDVFAGSIVVEHRVINRPIVIINPNNNNANNVN